MSIVNIETPKNVSISFTIAKAENNITIPTRALVILPLALSKACLSPPELIIPTAPVRNVKINQIIATIVIVPITVEMMEEKREMLFSPGFPKIPIPLKKPPFGANETSANKFIKLELLG